MSINPPTKFDITEDCGKQWKIWKQSFEFYMKAIGLSEKDDDVQVATLMSILGYEAITIFNSFSLKETEKKTFKTVIKHFDDYFLPKANNMRGLYNSSMQEDHESVEDYVAKLKNLSLTCEFGSLSEDLIKDRLVIGLRNEVVREKLLLESNPTSNTM